MSIFTNPPITFTPDTVMDEDCLNQEIHEKMDDIDAKFPAGIIVMWSGSIVSIPAGWFLCNGANGTPDLRDKFIVGAGSTYAVAATGGEATHTLITAEMPAHVHSGAASMGSQHSFSAGSPHETSLVSNVNTGSTGGGGAHENRPPYYSLAYIQKS